MWRNRRGFTLIELIIVIVVIGVLMAIAAPILRAARVKSICAEAVTGIGTIRTAMRAYRSDHGVYPSPGWIGVVSFTEAAFRANFPGLQQKQDLTGTYFGMECYFVSSTYIYCVTNPSTYGVPASSAPRASEAVSIAGSPSAWIRMTVVNGQIEQYNIPLSGYKKWP